MRRFILKTQKFKGHIEVLYNQEGQLRKLDFANVELSDEAIKWFKMRTAVKVENIMTGYEGTGVMVEESDFEVTFEDFLREYPYKRNTHLARAFWTKMTSSQQYQAFIGAIEYRKYCEKNTWMNKKIADEWLKKQQYLNKWNEL